MDTTASPSSILRIDKRYRHWAQDVATARDTAQTRGIKKEAEKLRDDVREWKERAVMGKPHAMFHRRQPSNILTVSVEVVNTLDSAGNIIAQQTTTPDPNAGQVAAATTTPAAPAVPTVPTVPAVPSVPTNAVPTVPAVPPFPSDLTVPGYPFTSSSPTASASSSQIVSISTTSPGVTLVLPSSGYNSTRSASSSSIVPSTSSLSSSLSSSNLSSSTRHITESYSSQTSTDSNASSQTSTILSSSSSSSTTSSAISSATASSSSAGGVVGGGGGHPANTAASGASPTAGITDAQSSSSGTLGTPQVVGTIFGTLAGAALLLALLLFLLRRHKRKQLTAPLQLTGDDHADHQPMTQAAAARGSFVAPSFLNRFSGASRSTVDTTSTGERGFQRISGRKLPSAFSEGLTSEQFARGEGTLSGSSFYKDDKGIYGGPGVVPKDFAFAKETGEPSHSGVVGTKERVMPSPARTPVLHHADDGSFGGGSTLSPPLTPNPDRPPTRGTLGRSHPSHDGSRSSRFTENV